MSLADPLDPPGGLTGQSVTAVSLTWERIQITIRAQLSAGLAVDPESVLVQRLGIRNLAVRPAHVDLDGDLLRVRVNVMQGPYRAPLWAGRWIVTVAPAGRGGPGRGETIPLSVASDVDLVPLEGRFPVAGRGDFIVRPELGKRDRILIFRVGLAPSAATSGTPGAPAVAGDDGTDHADAHLVRPHPVVRFARRWLRRGRGALFQMAFNGFRLAARRNGRRILFTSDSRPELGGNLKLVHERLMERGLNRTYELMELFKPGIATPRSWRDRFRLPWLLARADMVLIDDYQPAIYKVTDRKLRIIQLWHAYRSVKTVGLSRVGPPPGPPTSMRAPED